MSKNIGKIKAALAKLIADNFASVTSDKGVLYFDADELEAGVAVYFEDEEGNRTPAEDGEYTLDDERVIVVENGSVTEIREVEKPEVEIETPEVEVEAEDEPEVENPTNEGEETETEAIVELRKEVNELYQIVDALVKRIETLEGKPAAEPAQEEFEKVRFSNVKDKALNNIDRLF